MKKIIAGILFLLASPLMAAPRQVPYIDLIGPASATNSLCASSATANVFISSPTVLGVRNCLTHVYASVPSTGAPGFSFTINVLDGGTTVYSVSATTGNPVNLVWPPEDPICASLSSKIGITGTAPVTGCGTVNLSYKGYSY